MHASRVAMLYVRARGGSISAQPVGQSYDACIFAISELATIYAPPLLATKEEIQTPLISIIISTNLASKCSLIRQSGRKIYATPRNGMHAPSIRYVLRAIGYNRQFFLANR